MNDIGDVLRAWGNFYVMVGSSAGALTGLMFVVITLVRERESAASQDGVSIFSTPTVVHFCSALFVAALMAAPFGSIVPIAIIAGVAGLVGCVFVFRVARRTAKLEMYRPDVEDWTCNILLPFVAYAMLVVGALAMFRDPARALYAPAAATLLLIFVGIHNAWDVVTFLATGKADAVRAQATDENAGSDARKGTS